MNKKPRSVLKYVDSRHNAKPKSVLIYVKSRCDAKPRSDLICVKSRRGLSSESSKIHNVREQMQDTGVGHKYILRILTLDHNDHLNDHYSCSFKYVDLYSSIWTDPELKSMEMAIPLGPLFQHQSRFIPPSC